MEVHPPHETVHTWRDFAIHLAIMTIGLFIALTLESFVEYLHHRHIVHEARENIRQEIEDNHRAAQQDLVLLQQGIDLQKANIQAIHGLMAHPENFHGSVSNTLSYEGLHDAAWRTARDTAALSYMPYAEVQRYADVYDFEQLITNRFSEIATHDFQSAAPFEMGYSAGHLPADEYARLLHDNASVQIELATLREFVQQFDKQCVEELKN